MQETQPSLLSGLSVKHILWIIWWWKFAIVASVALGLVVAKVFMSFVPPKYIASAQILFDAAAEQLVSNNKEFRTSYGVHQVFQSATAMIASPGILKPVALKIMSQSAPAPSSKTPIQKILALPDLSDAERMAALIKTLQRSLTTRTQAANQIIVLEYKSSSAAEAASVANLIAATFIEERAASRQAALAQATEWLDKRSAEAKQRLIAVDKKIQDFKAKHSIEDATGSSALEAQLTRAREQLSTLQTRLAEARTVYETLNNQDSGGRKYYEKLAEGLGGPAMERLRSSLAQAQGNLASDKARLGAFHPSVKGREMQIAQIRLEIAAEVRRKQLSSKIAVKQLSSREQSLKEKIGKMESKVHALRAAEVQLLEFQRERDATKTLYDSMLAKVMEANLQRTLNFAQFRVLLNATVPSRPKLPPALIWAAGGIAGLGFGLFASLLLELLRGRIVTLEQARRHLPSKIITQVPLITKRDFCARGKDRKRYLRNFAKEFPRSLFANKLLAVQLAVNAARANSTSRIVMITSPRQGGGKTSITSNLAGLSVLSGLKTLLIDMDSIRPDENHEETEDLQCFELNTFLKDFKLEEVLSAAYRTKIGNYDVLRVRPSNEAASMRFFQSQVAELLEFVRGKYDRVWIDTPPVEIFTDPLLIASQVDGVMVIAEWSETTLKQMKDTIKLILESGGNVLGVIINKVRVDALISEPMASYATYYEYKKHADSSS